MRGTILNITYNHIKKPTEVTSMNRWGEENGGGEWGLQACSSQGPGTGNRVRTPRTSCSSHDEGGDQGILLQHG